MIIARTTSLMVSALAVLCEVQGKLASKVNGRDLEL
jgi:hypothetical protein